VPYAVRIGPFEIQGVGMQSLYVGFEGSEAIVSAHAHEDFLGLAGLVEQMPESTWRCEPGLAGAAKALGIEPADPSREVVEARAAIALGFTLGELAQVDASREVLWEFARAASAFWHEALWERPEWDRAFEVTLDGGVRGVFEAGVGGSSRTFGLTRGRGSMEKIFRWSEAGKPHPERFVSYVITFERGGQLDMAADALDAALGMPSAPVPLRIYRGAARPIRAKHLVALAATLGAIADVVAGSEEATVWTDVEGVRARAKVRRFR